MYTCTNNHCNSAVTHVYAQGLCFNCFNRTPKCIDGIFALENSTPTTSVGKKEGVSREMKDKVQDIINESIDTTAIPLQPSAYTRLDVRIWGDILKQKIKENIACNLRNL